MPHWTRWLKAEAETGGSLHTAQLARKLSRLRFAISSPQGRVTTSASLPSRRSRKPATWPHGSAIESNLTLDPDLDSYYVQNIAVKRVPALLSQMGELQSLLVQCAIG